jgi:hypothetical protein
MYKQIKNPNSLVSNKAILRVLDDANIPMDESNTDYQEYLKWVSEGNTPLPADE